MFSCLKDKLLALLAIGVAVLSTASIIYIYRIPVIGPDSHDQFLGISRETWILIRYMGYFIVGIIIFYFYHLYNERRIKKLEDKFSNYLKDLDDLNEEWADENEGLWSFIESTLKEVDIKKIKRKARRLLQQRIKDKKN